MSGMPVEQFADNINEVMPVIVKEFTRRQANELYKGKITLQQLFILELLFRRGELKMSALAQYMRVTTANMTGLIERLVRDGYAQRAYDPKDRRIINIGLTSKGQELVKKVSNQRRAMVIKIFGRLSEADRREYLRILMNIRDILTRDEKA